MPSCTTPAHLGELSLKGIQKTLTAPSEHVLGARCQSPRYPVKWQKRPCAVLWVDHLNPLSHSAAATPKLRMPLIKPKRFDDLRTAATSCVSKGKDFPWPSAFWLRG